ncbi:MAG: hypothetical protein AB7O78_03435 [Thermoleophilia bacterium]
MAVLLLAIGLAVGRWTASTDRTAARDLTPASVPPAPPTTPASGTGARTRSGAIAAAASAMTALARPELLFAPARRRVVAGQVAEPAYAAELADLFDRGYDHMARELGGGEASRVLLRLVPLGHRVESFSPTRARVAVWQVLLIGAPGGRVVASWSISRADLIWIRGGWRVAGFTSDEPGPGPTVTNAATATSPEVFLARLDGVAPFTR